MPDDTTAAEARAIAALAEMFAAIAACEPDMAALESGCIDAGHRCMASALSRALEELDAAIMRNRPEGLAVHDRRPRLLATEAGDVAFSIRRYRDAFGNDLYLLADRLDIPYGARISPGASEFLVEAASMASYARAAGLLARHGSRVDAASVMGLMRQTGDMCERDDRAAAEALYRDGILPEADRAEEELCMEADGTWFSVQHAPDGAPRRFEVKAMCAYAGKEERGGRTRRREVLHHAMAGTGGELWSEGVAQMGRSFDLAKLERMHLGGDGEPWCADAGRFLPRAEVEFHLDPFHVNRAISACCSEPKAAGRIIAMAEAGEAASAAKMLGVYAAFGLARPKPAARVIAYLENNADAIAKPGPSLGTVESDNQRLYGARMGSVPCAWSVEGGSDMARIISRRASGRAVPKLTREASMPQRRREARERKELAAIERRGCAGRMVESVGKGYLPPHQVDTRSIANGKAYALYRGMSNMDRGI